jgi:hypothetical protein
MGINSLHNATLVTLFAKQRGVFIFHTPLCGEAGERVVQRSDDRVSQLCALILYTFNAFDNI